MRPNLLRNLFLQNALTAGLLLSLATPLPAQEDGEKQVRFFDIEQITDAVLVSNISVAGKTIECGLFIKPPDVVQPVTPFQASPDWLRQMTISLINRTDRIIVYGSLALTFMDVGDCSPAQPCTSAEIHLGRIPAVDAFDGRTGRPLPPDRPLPPPIEWKPGQTLIVQVNDYMPIVENALQPFMPVTDVKKIRVSRGIFYFASGKGWGMGRYFVPIEGAPGKFRDLPKQFFPGRQGDNWPPGYNR